MIESAEDFVRLVESDDPDERRRAAWEPATDETWLDVIQTRTDMHFWVGHNRTVPEEILVRLVDSPDWRARFRLAGKNKMSAQLLDLLSRDADESVLAAVAGHPNTPVDALRRLADHPWGGVHEKARAQLDERGVDWRQRT